MRLTVVLIALLGCLAVVVTRTDSVRSSSWLVPDESKTQPKEVTLLKDSQSDKYGEVAFNHENHSLKKYSPDGTAALTCVECHHTDQPAAALKAPLKTSERDAVLTTADLAKAVLSNRAKSPAVPSRFRALSPRKTSPTPPERPGSGQP